MIDLLTRKQILEAKDIEDEIVPVPEWGGSVKVQGLTGTERDQFESALLKGKGKNTTMNLRNVRAKLVAHSIVVDDGNRVFNDHEVGVLGAKSAAALDRVFAVAQKLSGITKEDVEELAKNLDDAPSDGSGLS